MRRHQNRLAAQRHRDRIRAALEEALERARVAGHERMQLQERVAQLQQQEGQLREQAAILQQQIRGLQEQVALLEHQKMQLHGLVALHEQQNMHLQEQVARLLWPLQLLTYTNPQLDGSQCLLQVPRSHWMTELDMLEPDNQDLAEH